MASSYNPIHRHDFGVSSALARRACDGKKSCVWVHIPKLSKPLYVGKWMKKGSELGREIENESYLSYTKTYKERIKSEIKVL